MDLAPGIIEIRNPASANSSLYKDEDRALIVVNDRVVATRIASNLVMVGRSFQVIADDNEWHFLVDQSDVAFVIALAHAL